ncbi:hypothetical protein [Neobacillus dielmonensis]|uniref:hypothetical protein n=1 Tax=Neobacillus dielmonensis TaxID=1347369 RepID=UPI0005AB1021|nr:hypothetical protein [Neobacillus dielmonensis]
MNRIVCLCLLLLLLVSCQSEQVNDSSHIEVEDVVKVLKENKVDLIETTFSHSNSFGSELNKAEPEAYQLSGKRFYIYEFENEQAREKGLEEFTEKTATMNLVSYSLFEKRNVLIFYIHEQDVDSENIPFEQEIQVGLNSLIEG